TPVNSVDVCNTSFVTCSSPGSLLSPRQNAVAFQLDAYPCLFCADNAGGRFLVAGGDNGFNPVNDTALRTSQLWNLSGATGRLLTNMTTSRTGHRAVDLGYNGNKILVTGGW